MEEENEFTAASYETMLPKAVFKMQTARLTAPQRERIRTLITGAETLHAAGQSAAASDILMIAADFADGYRLVKPSDSEKEA